MSEAAFSQLVQWSDDWSFIPGEIVKKYPPAPYVL